MRNAGFWGKFSFNWGYTLAPHAAFGAFVMLLLLWMARTRSREGFWALYSRNLERVDLQKGIAPVILPDTQWQSTWQKAAQQVLGFI